MTEINYDLDVLGDEPNDQWRNFELPEVNLIVNPKVAWPRFVPSASTLGSFLRANYRNTPGECLYIARIQIKTKTLNRPFVCIQPR